MTTPSLRKAIWSNYGGLGQNGQGVQVRQGVFDQSPPPSTGSGTRQQNNSIDSRVGGEAFRDLDQASRGAVKFLQLPPIEMIYTEPMLLSLNAEPSGGIIALRIVNPLAPETPVPTSGMVHFWWNGENAVITSIDGMTSGQDKYVFYFLVVG